VLVLGGPALAATTLYVNAAGCNNATGSPSYCTIGAAVKAASPGDTIVVSAGTYAESVTVNKPLTIEGAESGVDARTRGGAPESVVTGTGNNGETPFIVRANGVTIDGFTIEGATNQSVFGFGILLGAGTHGSQIVNNIVENNIAGLALTNNSTTSQTLIERNLFDDNNDAGSGSGVGIYTDQFVAGGTVSDVLIDSNAFASNGQAGLYFSSTDPAQPATGITISNNGFDGNGSGLFALNITSSAITDNTFSNSTNTTASDIGLLEGVSGLTVTGNEMASGAGRAMSLGNLGTGAPNPTAVTFNRNAVTGYTGPTATVEADAYTGILDATCNWWGDITGPTNADNPGGAGTTVGGGSVTFSPWLTSSDLSAPCPDNDLALSGVPTNITVDATTSAGAVVTYTPPVANDEDGGSLTVDCNPPSGSTFPIGVTTVTCTTTDTDDVPNTATANFTVTVNAVADNDLALSGVPTNITVDATTSAGAVVTYTPPVAKDEDGNARTVDCNPPSGSTFPIGPTLVTCTASDPDDSNSPVSTSFTVMVNDTDLALTNVPADISSPATSSAGAVVTYTPPTIVDEDTPAPSLSCDHASGSKFPVGTTTVTCSASDSDDANSPVSVAFTVTVTDSDLALTDTPPNVTVNATTSAGAPVHYTPPTVTDEDAPLLTVACSAPSGSTFAIGTTTVTCTISDTDDSNSPVSSTFTVTVVGAAGQLQKLATVVAGIGPGGSLSPKVQQAQADLAAGDVADAKGVLNAFVNEVRAQTGKKITAAQAGQLILAVQQILAVLG
jgi:hypothetical protein